MSTILTWSRIVEFATTGNPKPARIVEKTESEWRAQLTPEQFYVTRQHGTERAFSSELCSRFEPGIYACVCCSTLLFDSAEKFDSGTGWPSFTQPIDPSAVAYNLDVSHGMQRIEAVCNTCRAHLGHVFPDGPAPSRLRYCMNAVALKKQEAAPAAPAKAPTQTELATFGGGCFWCTEAVFQQLRGVHAVVSGYCGGHVDNPTYKEVCGGQTGHAEVIQVTFDPQEISYADLVAIHLATHDPTTANRQGADVGTQYRSAIFTHSPEQAEIAQAVMEQLAPAFDAPLTTELSPLETFYPAEAYHQNYYNTNPGAGYCQAVISPKLQKARKLLQDRLK